MAVLEWKKFDFFNLGDNADSGKLADNIRDGEITCCASGRSQKIICDSLGRVHIFYRNWDCISYSGHDAPIILCALALQSNLLVTVASHSNSEPATIKMWNLAKVTKRNGAPCLKVAKCTILQRPTAIAVIDNVPGLLFAIGFERGELVLYKGEVSRDLYTNPTQFTVGTRPVTGIAFKPSGKLNHMFVCSDLGILVYTIQQGERESKLVLDQKNAATRCCTLQMRGFQETYFMAARDDAVYCYTTDGRGPCYALEGQKFLIEWFRNYIVTILKSNKPSLVPQKEYVLIVIDIQNKFIVYTAPIDPVVSILNESGTCYIVTKNKEVLHLFEKDLQNKLNMLFKKNLYDIAIRVSKDQQYDGNGLAYIYKQYGDHLYIKGNYLGAVEKYVKTIGYVEPSYVIKKFFDSRHINFLVEYLKALHVEKKATSEHTSLLMNCFSRLDLPNKLNDFLVSDLESSDFVFDLNDALRSQNSFGEGVSTMQLTKINRIDDCNVNVLLKNFTNSDEILKFISKFPSDEVENFFQKYGLTIMNHSPEHATQLFKQVSTIPIGSNDVISADTFIPFFSDYQDHLFDFLEYVVNVNNKTIDTVYSYFIEMYLKKWQQEGNADVEAKLLEILKIHEGSYDKEFILIQCRLYNFWPGILQLYEEEQLYNLTIRYYLKNRDYNSLLACCKNLGKFQPYLWVQALNGLHNDEKVPMSVLLQILEVIATEKLQSPLQIVQGLTADNGPKIGHIRDFFVQAFHKEAEKLRQEQIDVENLKTDVADLQNLLHSFAGSPLQFLSTACDACNQPLTIPSVYFLCQHSFHLDCVRNYSENEKDCSMCIDRNTQLIEILKTPHEEQNLHESFHKLIDSSKDPLQVLSGYLGRSLFNKIVIFDELKPKDLVKPSYSQSPQYNPISVPTREVPLATQTKIYVETKSIPMQISHTKSLSKNPFEEERDNYDQSKNPFADDDGDDGTKKTDGNPFDEYDKNLNPFN